ncbi:MAG: hypothetical protein K2L07_12990 [Lachnospiraceae bacterium]|nr:hypothetical protein [Lachnospiraceae bacterium]
MLIGAMDALGSTMDYEVNADGQVYMMEMGHLHWSIWIRWGLNFGRFIGRN